MVMRLVLYEFSSTKTFAFKFGSWGFALARFLLINYHFKFKLSLNNFDVKTIVNEQSGSYLFGTDPKKFKIPLKVYIGLFSSLEF